jgi:hypothetical protein
VTIKTGIFDQIKAVDKFGRCLLSHQLSLNPRAQTSLPPIWKTNFMPFPISIPPRRDRHQQKLSKRESSGVEDASESAQAGPEKKAATGTAGFKVPLIATAGGLVTAAALVAVLGRGACT